MSVVRVFARRHVSYRDIDFNVAVDFGTQRIKLDAYEESAGVDAFAFRAQKLRQDFIGASAKFNEVVASRLGDVIITGTLGYRANISRDNRAVGHFAADPLTVFHHTVSRDNSHQSTSHLHLEAGAAMETDGG